MATCPPPRSTCEVEDVDAEHARLVGVEGRRVALDLRSEDVGQRHFILVAPGDVLVDVIQPIRFTGPYEGLDAPAEPARATPVTQPAAPGARPTS